MNHANNIRIHKINKFKRNYMKTKLIRPILLESKKDVQLWINLNNKLCFHPSPCKLAGGQQLILISLESNEKIAVGDMCHYGKSLFLIETIVDNRTYLRPNDLKIQGKFIYDMSYCEFTSFTLLKKVVFQQSQLSPELINKLIEEYNSTGKFEDFEIEMEEFYLYPDGNKSKIARLAPNAKPIEESKLTNGFITPVGKDNSDREVIEDVFNKEEIGTLPKTEFNPPILYTEEEARNKVVDLANEFICENGLFYNKIIEIEDIYNWFEAYKK